MPEQSGRLSPKRAGSNAFDAAMRLLVNLDLPPSPSINMNNPKSLMHIQRAASSDLDEIQGLLSTLDLPHRDLTPSHLEHFLLCRDEDEIKGIVGLEIYGKTALLRSLAVHPSYRNRGLGARLTEKIEQYGHRKGVEAIYLLTTTASEYFDHHGYETVSRDELPTAIQETEEAARLCPSSATCMRKIVGEPEEETT